VTPPLSFDAILLRFGPAKRSGKEWRVRCPVHGDGAPSLDIAEGSNGPLFACRSHGCSANEILAAVELTWADVLQPRPGKGLNGSAGHGASPWLPDAVYDYRSREGVLLYQVLRKNLPGGAKQILQRQANGQWNLKGVEPVPYRLQALAGPTVLIAEGEKVVEALVIAGFEATCNSGGAKKWRDSDTLHLKACGITTLLILPDHDLPGREHADLVAASAAKHGLTSRLVVLPGLGEGEDAYDWLLTHTAAELEALLDAPEAAPGPEPEPEWQLDPAFLADSTVVAAEGIKAHTEGIPWTVEGLIPAGGMLGMMIARAKVGKTSLGLALAQAVGTGAPFLGQATTACKVLVVAAEDPPLWIAILARHMTAPFGQVTFYRAPIQLTAEGCARIAGTAKAGGYGLVLIASWQAVITSLVENENDNAGAARVVETVKAVVRKGLIPWMIDAHAGKGEDQSDDADPTLALRGASAAAGAADYLLSLRYAGKPFEPTRRLSGKGRLVDFKPITLTCDLATGTYTVLSTSPSDYAETTWASILAVGALAESWVSAGTIATMIGLVEPGVRPNGHAMDRVRAALKNPTGKGLREGIAVKSEPHGKTMRWFYRMGTVEGDE